MRWQHIAIASGVICMCIVLAGARPAQHDDLAAIIKWEHDAARADLIGDGDFYLRNLSDRWTDGMSDGTFQDKQMLVADLRDSARNTPTAESLADIKVNIFDQVAVATYRETYPAVIHSVPVQKTIITTDTFVKQSGR